MTELDQQVPGRYFYIEFEANPEDPGPFKGQERQRAGAYATATDARRDFQNVVLFVSSKFPGSRALPIQDLPDDIEEAVDLVRVEGERVVKVLSHVRITCIDHRGQTKH